MSSLLYFFLILLTASPIFLANDKIRGFVGQILKNYLLYVSEKFSMRLSDFFKIIFLGKKTILRNPQLIVSQRCAQNRRGNIINFLHKSQKVNKINEFLEVPPGYEVELLKINRNDLAGQLSTLKYEQNSEQLLLLGRVMDALKCIDRIQQKNLFKNNGDSFALNLETNKKSNLFPWKVVIRASYFPNVYLQELRRLNNWLGIGIEYVKTSGKNKILGKCRNGGAEKGLIGGNIHTSDNQTFQVTCAHVISDNCQSCHFSPKRTNYDISKKPDVAILNIQQCTNCDIRNSCFIYPNINGKPIKTICRKSYYPSIVKEARNSDINYYIQEKKLVQKIHPGTNNISGIINGYTKGFTINGVLVEIFHISIVPFSSNSIINFFYDLLNINFSKPGDSGSWVFDLDSGLWIGMISASFGNIHSYVIPSELLVDFISNNLSQDIHTMISWTNHTKT